MTDFPRLIEHAFPLKQTSLDSVHEKNVRHGHISTLHIWPARRPLAACRAALIATLLPDPGTPEKRRDLCEKIGGKVIKTIERKKMPGGQVVERVKEETEGGILHWGQETANAADLEWLRQEIRKAYGGRAPRVLDPFAGGGAIPLEAIRLGCETTAVDINPVAWFILKCTLEYPQKLAGQKRPLPAFILDNEEFMDAFYKANPDAEGKGKATKKQKETLFAATKATHGPEADLAWHVRAWGQWVVDRARAELARFYPTYADFEPLKKDRVSYERQPMRVVPLREDCMPDIATLNGDFSADYLAVKDNPRWIAKPTVAYLWARTVTCKNCRATLPLLKTRWLCRKDRKRVLLAMQPTADGSGVAFGIQTDVPVVGGNAAQNREHDRRVSAGTMSRAGAKCPCCAAIMTGQDIQVEARAGRMHRVITAVVVDTPDGKWFRLPTPAEAKLEALAEEMSLKAFSDIPFGPPDEAIPRGASRKGGGSAFTVVLYGFDKWKSLFTARQLHALATFVKHTRAVPATLNTKLQFSDPAGSASGESLAYPPEWAEAILAALGVGIDRLADRQSMICRWDMGYSKLQGTFTRFALPMLWDFCEGNPLSDTTGNYTSCLEWVAEVFEHSMATGAFSPHATVSCRSAIQNHSGEIDCIITDPPYYDAIPYSDLMDFFYVWLRRTLHGLSPEIDSVFQAPLSPKWRHETQDGELVDDVSRHGGDATKSKMAYEDGMFRAFVACNSALTTNGRLVVVFAHKHPDAWETLVSAIIRAGFVVDASWPIMTEMSNRQRALAGAALSSSVWMVCKKRPVAARVGWDTAVLEEMREKIRGRLREYWDAGIRGPDFVWAATGPALEAYSKHPAVKKADQPGQIMTVTEFLNHVRRMVVDYVVGQVLSGEKKGEADLAAADRLDEVTAYYLLHRHDFGMQETPSGTCILYAVSCGLSDSALARDWDILAKTGADDVDEDETEVSASEDSEEEAESTGGKVRLKTWSQRKNKSLGYEAPNGRSVPLIDRVHRLMHLWKAGDVHKVDEYLDEHGMRRHELFKRLVQSLIELSEAGSDERALLESLSNHIGAKGTKADASQTTLDQDFRKAGYDPGTKASDEP